MYSRILVGVDGSECAKKAFNSALALAKEFGARLYVVCVVQTAPVIGLHREQLGSLEKIIERQAKVILAECATRADMKGVRAETVLAKGHPAQIILYTAKAEGADLIIVGSRGLGGMKEMLLGSVSSAVVHNSKVPVMVVK